MSASSVLPDSAAQDDRTNESCLLNGSLDEALVQAIKDVHAIVPPLWPLADYVAVNPCVGLTDRGLLEAHQLLGSVRDCDLLMPRKFFQAQFLEGKLSAEILSAAHAQCLSEYPEWYRHFDLTELTEWLSGGDETSAEGEIRFRTVAEAVDQTQASSWSSHIVNDITRHCAAHYDEGQAAWSSPWKSASLYTAWREASKLGRRMDLLGLPGFRALVASLPACPTRALDDLLRMLNVPPSHARLFLLCQSFSVAGWASFVRYQVRESENAGKQNEDLTGLLAMRLAYDAALAQAPGIPWPLPLWPADADMQDGIAVAPRPTADVLARYALQVACELAYRRPLLQKLRTSAPCPKTSTRKSLQMVFCIDVRSEVMRRHLESIDASIETFGFAGFFGMPLEYVPLGSAQGTPQCPVLLQPSFQVHEHLRGLEQSTQDRAAHKRLAARLSRKLWKAFQSSATSCFSFVESLGLPYLGKLLSDSLKWTTPVSACHGDGLSLVQLSALGPDVHAEQNRRLDAKRRLDLAEGMLRNLGLMDGFARLVVLCGHASDVANNPYRAALDCGACGGHSGEPNARVTCALLNDAEVRSGLAQRGIAIPADTWFLAAVHHTTTDEIRLCDAHLVPNSHAADVSQITGWFQEAGRLCRIERGPRLGSVPAEQIIQRSRDWSEVRPEWGLAGNAAFLVAPRSRTVNLDLGGRTFLHSYDHRLDPELKVLELILTAPMVVTNWINMQYYASTVDPIAFGSGNKVIHNVVGQFGVLQGNGGDLMTGLPWQSVHDGEKYQHEPLRLLVVVDAPRTAIQQIIERHALVKNLASNGWVSLMAWEGNDFFLWTSAGTWAPYSR